EFTLLCATILICRAISQIVLVHLAQRGMFELIEQLSRTIIRIPLQRIEDMGQPRLIAALTDDVAIVTSGLTAIPSTALAVTIVVGSFIYLGWLSLVALVYAILFLVLLVVSFRVTLRFSEHFFELSFVDRNEFFDGFRGLIDGLKELK